MTSRLSQISESKTAKRGDRLEAGSGRQACGAGPLLSATSLESESAEVRTLFRKQVDRPCRLRRESSALRQLFSSCSSKAEQSADNRSIPERYRARGPFYGGLIPKVGSRGANACGDSFR